LMDLDSGDVKRRVHLFETQRRTKEEDPIIPFSDGPIISKWGAISRSSRTGYHTTDPVQATASQGSATKPISVSGGVHMATRPHHQHTMLKGTDSLLLIYLVIESIPVLGTF
ncbi:ring finger and CCCH-type domains 2, partial [Homo sapiens]